MVWTLNAEYGGGSVNRDAKIDGFSHVSSGCDCQLGL
jgi:hypothetical protein